MATQGREVMLQSIELVLKIDSIEPKVTEKALVKFFSTTPLYWLCRLIMAGSREPKLDGLVEKACQAVIERYREAPDALVVLLDLPMRLEKYRDLAAIAITTQPGELSPSKLARARLLSVVATSRRFRENAYRKLIALEGPDGVSLDQLRLIAEIYAASDPEFARRVMAEHDSRTLPAQFQR